jgi:hypothetical protein
MKRILFVLIVVLAAASFAAAQNYSPSTDVLGAHLNYGRGCTACHAPHSGVYGNGNAKTADSTSGNVALWGQDVGSLYGQTLTFGGTAGGNYPETLPTSFNATTPDVSGLLTCLSCHDGNYATGAMMKNQVYETLPLTYGKFNTIPTLLGRDGTTVGNYLNDHPVGLNAVMSCGGTYDWDCTISATGKVQMTGPNSSKFVTNYGFFVSPGAYNNQPVVLCTTCHNQHLMNVVKVTASKSGLTPGYYQTMFFIRAPYNPGSITAGSNQTAQFCRQCHGGESNEMNNGTAVTIF